jgi:hypothetical protein
MKEPENLVGVPTCSSARDSWTCCFDSQSSGLLEVKLEKSAKVWFGVEDSSANSDSADGSSQVCIRLSIFRQESMDESLGISVKTLRGVDVPGRLPMLRRFN